MNPTTATRIRTLLGPAYDRLVKLYDIKTRERRATARAKKQLERKECVGCGQGESRRYRLEAAHIAPLAECQRTRLANLVWLCRAKPGMGQLGCHTLFDRGYSSVDEVRKARRRWQAGRKPVLRRRMQEQLRQFGTRAQQQGHLKKEIDQRRAEHSRMSPKSDDWIYLQIDIAALERRRTRKDALPVARAEIAKVPVDRIIDSLWRSRYFYEKGYIELLSGRPREAFAAFDAARSGLSGWRWAAHTALAAQVSRVMNEARMSGGWSWQRIEKELSKALECAKNDELSLRRAGLQRVEERRHAQRWVQNCLLHLMKPALGLGKLKRADLLWNQAANNWQKMDLSSGWDVGFRSTQLFLYGKLQLAQHSGCRGGLEALPYLVRSLVRMVGLRQQQPEGSRDLLYAIAEALERRGDPLHKRVRRVAENCVDFSSWFHPYLPRPPIVRQERRADSQQHGSASDSGPL
jgi:hypothetical protein